MSIDEKLAERSDIVYCIIGGKSYIDMSDFGSRIEIVERISIEVC